MSDYNLGTASGRIVVDGSGAAKGFGVAQTAGDAFFRGVQTKVNDVQNLGKKMAGIGAAGVAGFGVAVNSAANFEQAMSNLNAVTNVSAGTMDKLKAKALEMGARTVYSATESAGAMEELAKAGLSTTDILGGAADATVDLAAAGGIELPNAATIAANAMNQFNLNGKDMAKVADLFAGAAATSAADVQGLGDSLAQVGAVAHLSGQSLEETTIALGLMADAGIKGSDAGTSLKTMLMNLNPVTKRQKDTMKELGLITKDGANKFLDAAGNIKPLRDISELLNKSLGFTADSTKRVNKAIAEGKDPYAAMTDEAKKLGNAQQLLALESIFGSDAIRAAAIMAKEGSAGFEKFNKSMEGTTAAEIAKERLNNLKGAMEGFQGSLETLMIKIGGPLLKPLTLLVKGVTAVINAISGAPKWVFALLSPLAALASIFLIVAGLGLAMLPMLLGMASSMVGLFVVRSLMAPIMAFGKALFFTRSAAAASAAATTAAKGRWLLAGKVARGLGVAAKIMAVGFRVLMFAMSGPGLAIIALIAGLVLLYKNFKPFRELVNGIASAIKGGLIAAFNGLKKAAIAIAAIVKKQLIEGWAKIKESFAGLGTAINKLKAAFSGMSGMGKAMGPVGKAFASIGKALAPVGAAFGKILPIIVKIVGFITGVFIDSVVMAVTGIIDVVTGIVTVITGIVNVIKGILTGDWALVWKGLKQIASGALKALIGFIKVYFAVGILKVFGLAFSALKGVALAALKGVGKAIMGGFKGIFNGLKGLFGGGGGGGLLSIITAPFRLIGALFKLQFKIITTIFKAAWTAITAVARAAWWVVVNIFKLGWTIISTIFRIHFAIIKAIVTTGLNIIRAVFGAVFGVLRTIVVGAFNVMRAVITTSLNVIRTIVTTVFNAIKTVIMTVVRVIVAIVRAQFMVMKTIFTTVFNAIKAVVTTAFNIIKGLAQKGMAALVGAIRAAISKAKAAFTAVKDAIVGVAKGFGKMLLNAGKALINGLVDGIKAVASKPVDAVKKIASEVKGLFGGSPVEWGPLKSWNRGGAGKNIVGMLTDGILAEQHAPAAAMARVANNINDPMVDLLKSGTIDIRTLRPPATLPYGDLPVTRTPQTAPGVAARANAEKVAETKFLKLVGELDLTSRSTATVKGMAAEVDDSNEKFSKTMGRQGGDY